MRERKKKKKKKTERESVEVVEVFWARVEAINNRFPGTKPEKPCWDVFCAALQKQSYFRKRVRSGVCYAVQQHE